MPYEIFNQKLFSTHFLRVSHTRSHLIHQDVNIPNIPHRDPGFDSNSRSSGNLTQKLFCIIYVCNIIFFYDRGHSASPEPRFYVYLVK